MVSNNAIRDLKNKARELFKNNNIAEAKDIYTSLCQSLPVDTECWVNLAVIHRKLNKLNEAEFCCNHILKKHPNSSLALHTLASVFHRKNDINSAIHIYKKALQADKPTPETLYFMANAYREIGDTNSAISYYQKHLEKNPDHFETLNNISALFTSLGHLDKANQYLKKAENIEPNNVHIKNNIARNYLQASAISPNNPNILTNLANAYTNLAQTELALKACQQAIAIQADFFDAHKALGLAHLSAGDYEKAVTALNAALELKPGNVGVITLLARSWHFLGDNEKVYDLLKPLIGKRVPEIAIIYFQISDKLGIREQAVAYMLNILKNKKKKSIQDAGLQSIYYSLGKHYDQMSSYKKAFSYFSKANALSKSRFDINAISNIFDDIIKAFPNYLPDKNAMASNTSNQPVFIIGMPRSGTSLVEQILSSHSQVFGAGELLNIDMAVKKATTRNNDITPINAFDSLSTQELDDFAADYLNYISNLSNRSPRVVDKMPQNFLHIGFILRLFPSAHIINCVRHPLDTCLSCYFSEFGFHGHEYSYNLNDAAKYYLEYNKLMSHWNKLHGDKILQVKYEDLIMNQEKFSKMLIQHCGLEWEEQCLDFYKNKKTIRTLSYDQVNKPIYRKSMFRWKNHSKDLVTTRKILSDIVKSYEDELTY